MIEGWFWYQTPYFGMNFLKKNFENFFWAKKKFFWPRGGHFGYPRPPSTMKLEILIKNYQFHINLTLESAKKSLGIDLYQGYKNFQKSHLWLFFSYFDILAYLQLLNGHNMGSTNDKKFVLVSNITFRNEHFKK